MTDWLARTLAELRAIARRYHDDGFDAGARAYTTSADLLEERWQAYGNEPLTVAQAAEESGYEVSAIRRMRVAGKIPFEPDGKVLRKNLPRKPGHGVAQLTARPQLHTSSAVDALANSVGASGVSRAQSRARRSGGRRP